MSLVIHCVELGVARFIAKQDMFPGPAKWCAV